MKRTEPYLESEPVLIGSIVAPELSPTVRPDGRRYRELEGQRGIAVVAIVVFDVYQFCNTAHFLYDGTPAYRLINSLDAMVPWLFVLTAFLLFEPIARALINGRDPISVRRFLARRAVRILPAYYVAIIVVWFPRQQNLPGDWRDLVEHLTFTQVFDSKRIFYTIGPAWAVSVLVVFYVALMVVSAISARICTRTASRRTRVAVLAAGTLALAAISFAWKAWSFSVQHRPTIGSFTTWFGPAANMDVFAVGMAIAIVVAAFDSAPRLGHRSRALLRVGAMTILWVAFATRRAGSWSGVYFSTVCSIGFGCLVAAAVLGPPKDLWARALSGRPLLWLGTISFSVYLWHEPIMLALRGQDGLVHQAPGAFLGDATIVVLASLFVGAVGYWLIERPTSQLREWFRHAELARASAVSGPSGSVQTIKPARRHVATMDDSVA